MCTQIKKTFTQHFFTTFSIVLTPSDPFYKLNFVLTFCYLEYMLPLMLFTTMYPVSPILHFVAFLHVITVTFARCATLAGKSLYDFLNFFNSNNGTATTLRLERKYLVWKMVTKWQFLILHCRGQTVACKCSQIGLGQWFQK